MVPASPAEWRTSTANVKRDSPENSAKTVSRSPAALFYHSEINRIFVADSNLALCEKSRAPLFGKCKLVVLHGQPLAALKCFQIFTKQF